MATPDHDDSIRVLHVEDDREFAEMTATLLERENEAFTVTVETRPENVPDRLHEDDVDCLLSDYDMPELNGLELLQRVREEYPDLPFVLFTGKGSEEIASEAISAGVTDYLQKGTGTDQYRLLGNRIRNAVKQYRTEQAHRNLYQQYRDLVENAPYAVFVYQDERITYANEAWADLLNADQSQVEGLRKEEFIAPDDQPSVEDRIERVRDEEERVEWREKTIECVDGETRIVESSGAPVTYEGTQGLQVVARDVTERVQRERQLRAAKERFETIFEYSYEPIMIIDPERDEIYDANQQACELLGYSHEELTSLSPSDIHPHEIDRFQEFVATVTEEGQGWRDDLSCYTCDGDTIPVDATASLIELEGRSYMLAILRTPPT